MLPKPIYELLPYIYALRGLLAIINLEHPLGYLGGALLILVAMVVGLLRNTFRSPSPFP